MTEENKIEFDKDGYMIKPEAWTDEVAVLIAKDEGIVEMDEIQWKIVKFIRGYWNENGTPPSARQICKDAEIGVRQIYRLFTSGPERGACRIAGLPKPNSCV